MANTFYRKPTIGGDVGAWGPYNDALNDASLGVLTGKLYNDAGALKVPVCKIGIDNGTNRGICDIDTVTTISLAGVSNSIWAAIEMSISGTAVTFTATDIAGATDPTIIPASVRAAFDGAKGGFYLTATKRCIGLAWKHTTGVLLAVVNFDGQKIWASEIGLHTGTIHTQDAPGMGFLLSWSAWNMDTDALFTLTTDFYAFVSAQKECSALVYSNAGVINPITLFGNGADPTLLAGGIVNFSTIGAVLSRRAGGAFDAAGWNAAYGFFTVHMRDF